MSNHAHVQAVPEPDGDERCFLEHAFYDVEELLSIFAASGFDGYVNLEFVTERDEYEEAIERDLEFLRSCLE